VTSDNFASHPNQMLEDSTLTLSQPTFPVGIDNEKQGRHIQIFLNLLKK
jgi:hypothetical protein